MVVEKAGSESDAELMRDEEDLERLPDDDLEEEDRLAALMKSGTKSGPTRTASRSPIAVEGSPGGRNGGPDTKSTRDGSPKSPEDLRASAAPSSRKRSRRSTSPIRMADSWVSEGVASRGGRKRDRGEEFDSWVAESGRYIGWERDRKTNIWGPPRTSRNGRDREFDRDREFEREVRQNIGRERGARGDDRRRDDDRIRKRSPSPRERRRNVIRAEPMAVGNAFPRERNPPRNRDTPRDSKDDDWRKRDERRT